MRLSSLVNRKAAVRALLGAAVLAVGLGIGSNIAQPANAGTPRVLMYDNDGGFTPGDASTGMWGFVPAHITVMQGETIDFVNPAGNFRPHTVTSISAPPLAQGSQSLERQLQSGAQFDSSPTRDALVAPGGNWMLDTSAMAPGHYTYYCTLHLWMVGSLTVTPAAQ